MNSNTIAQDIQMEPTRPDYRRKRSEVGNLPQNQTKTLTLTLHVEEYDIVLTEKMDDVNCLALILNVSRVNKLFLHT